MERRTIKLPTGYLNVDDEAITFTRSGNWGEASKVKERKAVVTFGSAVRVILGFWLLTVAFLGGIIKSQHRGGGELMPLVAVGLGFFSFVIFFRKMKDGFLSTFRIPFSKVRALRYDDGEAVIGFMNGAWKDDVARARVTAEDFAFIQGFFARSRAR